jgi:hypothetical protein
MGSPRARVDGIVMDDMVYRFFIATGFLISSGVPESPPSGSGLILVAVLRALGPAPLAASS